MTTPVRQHKYFILTGLLVALSFLICLQIGRFPISTGEIFSLLTGGEVPPLTRSVFFNLRLPRTVMALLAGAGLGFAGSVFQLVFRNPLAAPDIVGVSSGANLGAAVAIVMFGQSAAVMTTLAFGGGMLVLFLVMFVARLSRNPSTVTYILAGIVMRALSDALIMILRFFADPARELATMDFWAMGSLGNITMSNLITVLPFFIVGFIGLTLLRRQIVMLGLEDDEAKTLGVRLKSVRLLVLALAALLVASIVSQTGLIAFAGLIAPHAARLAIRRISFSWCMLSALMGAFILLVSDSLARGLTALEIPISVPTTLIGVPVLLYFMWRRKTGKV
ncbi:MAG: iron ABC transporter permease [Oscillospiraceae bacterium]|nr:iron ABC transporter permease [Oscillospiraceae bacterium]MCL2278916.1 iron ABC transporter permease [Oscillospiraceae bacterium]